MIQQAMHLVITTCQHFSKNVLKTESNIIREIDIMNCKLDIDQSQHIIKEIVDRYILETDIPYGIQEIE
jgi:hypothetical protein